MSWTAKLTQLQRVRSEWRISIFYTDTISSDTIQKSYRRASITKKQLKSLAISEAAALLGGETTDINIPIGTTIDVTPDPVIPPDPPTQAEIDRRAWFADWDKLNQLLKITGTIPALATNQANNLIASLTATLEADWDNSYLSGIE